MEEIICCRPLKRFYFGQDQEQGYKLIFRNKIQNLKKGQESFQGLLFDFQVERSPNEKRNK